MSSLLTQLIQTSLWEYLAVILALFYIILAIKGSRWCWGAGFLSTLIYSILFLDVRLYMESLLNIYYLIIALYGWKKWNSNTQQTVFKLQTWSIQRHILLLSSGFILVLINGWLLNAFFASERNQNDWFYMDSFTTVFSVIATYMLTQKIVENWFYWIVIDTLSIVLFFSKGLILTGFLFATYTLLAIYGGRVWWVRYQKQSTTPLKTYNHAS
jgi:nicotinamide mononucleotide transporter